MTLATMASDTLSTVKLFDISTKSFKKFAYTKLLKQHMGLKKLLSLTKFTVDVLVDKQGIGGISKSAFVLTVNIDTGKIIATIPYTKYQKSHKTFVSYGDQCFDNCPLFINGQKVTIPTIYTSLYFTTMLNNNG